jgi:hypothetical protein
MQGRHGLSVAGRIGIWAVLSLILLLLVAQAGAAIPKKITYQGRLTDTGGNPLPGEHTVFFSLHNVESGGIMLWSETQTVTADSSGVFSAILGSTTPIQISFADPKWLSITVDSQPISPRREIVSVASAFNAQNADSLGNSPPSAYSQVGHTHYSLAASDGSPVDAVYVDADGRVGIGTTTPDRQLKVVNSSSTTGAIAINGQATSTADIEAFGVRGDVYSVATSLAGAGVMGYAGATTGLTCGVRGETNSDLGSGVYGWATHTTGVNYGVMGHTSSPNGFAGYFSGGRNYFEGRVGIGTDEPGSRLHVYDGSSGATADLGASLVVEGVDVAEISFLTSDIGLQGLVFGDPESSHQGWIRYNHDGDKMTFGTGDVEQVAIADDHKVGFGTLNPECDLHIQQKTDHFVGIKIENDDTGSSSNEGIVFSDENGDSAGIVTHDDGSSYANAMRIWNSRPGGSVRLEAGGVEGLRVTSGGKVGIGATSPAYNLSVHKDGVSLSYVQMTNGTTGVTDNDGFRVGINGSGYAFIINEENTPLQFSTNDQTRATIAADGKVGIATTSPTAALDVNGSTGYNQVRMRTSYTPTTTTDPNGSVGDMAWDDNFIYIKTSTGWKRAALTVFGL